jgi:hypothetical protein
VRDAEAFGAGIGWWPNRAIRFMANYDTTTFTSGAPEADRSAERAILIRSQVAW